MRDVRTAGDPSPTVSMRRVNALNFAVWPGDFNGDGITDLVASDPWVNGPPAALVALGKGDGTFGAPLRTGCACRVLGTGDFDNDGKLDLLVEELPEPDISILVLRGNGDGTFGTGHMVTQASGVFFGLASDVDRDGNLDVVLGVDAEGVNLIVVVPGNGDMTFRFETATVKPAAAYPNDGAIADLNNDGRPDIAVANHGGHSISILMNQGAFDFAAVDVAIDGQANDVAAADVNRDGKVDLIVAVSHDANDDYHYTDGFAEVLLGNGNGTFATPVAYATARGAWQVAIGDFTRDGILDIATANRSSIYAEDCDGPLLKTWDSVSIVPGRSDGTFGAASSFSLQNQSVLDDTRFTNSVRSLAVADLNRDGAADLVASWGAILINQPTDPNWAPTVDLSQSWADTNAVHLRVSATDVDQDMLTYTWSASDGHGISPVPTACVAGWATPGSHTYTVTVDDGHGHQITKSITFTVSGGDPTFTPITITSPARGETVPAHQPYVIRWTTPTTQSDGETLLVYLSTDGGSTSTFITECNYVEVRAHQCTWNDPGPITEQAIISMFSRDADVPARGGSEIFKIADVPASSGVVPSPWRNADIGAVAAAGAATYTSESGGVFTVSGSGADIWGTADEFHYVYQQRLRSFEINTRVDSVQNVHAWTKAGLMVRTSLDPDAPQASIFVTPGKGIAFQRRASQGATSISTSRAGLTAPVWLRLTGFNGSVSAYYKKNLTDRWILLGQAVLSTYSSVLPYVGLAVTSHADGTLATATFSQVGVGNILDWSSGGSIGCSDCGASYDGTFFELSARSSDIWGAADAFQFNARPINGDATITARVDQVDNTHAWGKAGVMFRETGDAGSKYVFAMVTPGKGVNLQYRAATNGLSASAASIAGTPPGWLRLQRAGDAFTAYWSTDGVTFVPIGHITLTMNSSVLAGMAYTDHNASVRGTSLFEEPNFQQRP